MNPFYAQQHAPLHANLISSLLRMAGIWFLTYLALRPVTAFNLHGETKRHSCCVQIDYLGGHEAPWQLPSHSRRVRARRWRRWG